MPTAAPLTGRRQRFVAAYLANECNATKAALAAGYSPRRAMQTGSRLVRNGEVAAALAAATTLQLAATQATAAQVIQRATAQALVDPRKFFDAEGNLKPLSELDRDTACCIAGFDVVTRNLDAGDNRQDRVVKIRLTDSTRALELLAKYHGLAQPAEVRVGLTDDLMAMLSAARKRIEPPVTEAELLIEQDRHEQPGAER